MEFIEAPSFTRHLQDYLNEDQYRKLQTRLAANPEMGDLMPGTGGFRKMRWADARRGKGRFANYLLSLCLGSSNMAYDTLRQRRGLRPDSGRKETTEKRGTSRTQSAITGGRHKIEEDSLMTKRNILGELMEGVAAMKGQREGKITLRSFKVESAPLPKVDSKLIRDTRKKLRCSRAVFARRLRINERTLEKWEQGRAKPNPQAAALVLLVRRYPDTLTRLDEVAEG
jgi:putative transcriptional regulator